MAEVAAPNGSEARQPAELEELAKRINEQHRACQTAARTALEHAMAAGDLLLQAKDECPHGTWQAWVADNFDGSLRTAQIYMYLARRREEIGEAKTQSSALLSISEALHKVALRQIEALPAPPELQQVAEQPAPDPLPLGYSRESRDVWQEHDEYLAKQYTWDQARLAVRRGDLEQPASVDMPAQEWQALVEQKEEERIGTAKMELFGVLRELNDLHFSIGYYELKPQEAGVALARMDDGDHPVTLPIREGAIADLRFGITWLQRVLEEAEQEQARMQKPE